VAVAAAMAVVGTGVAVMAAAVTQGLSAVPAPGAGRIAAMAAVAATASTLGVPVVAAVAAAIIPAPKSEEPGGLEPPLLQLLGGCHQHFGSGVPPAGLLGDGVSPVACSIHPLHQMHQVAGDGP